MRIEFLFNFGGRWRSVFAIAGWLGRLSALDCDAARNIVKIEPFDTARHLDNPEVISHYLREALETGDRKLIVLRASRIADLASATGLSRTSLYWKNKADTEQRVLVCAGGSCDV